MARARVARIKLNRSYTVEEAAETVGLSQQTIRAWIARGMPALTAQRPTLIMGFELKAFAERQRGAGSRKLAIGEFRCFTCKAARRAAFELADYQALTEKRGQLHAFCDECGGKISRFVGLDALPLWRAHYEIGGDCEG